MSKLQAQSIFIQIADTVKDRILDGTYPADGRIPSVRELAEEMEVNPNTAMRSIERLQQEDLIYNKRGLGYFVSPSAKATIESARKEHFIEEVLPAIFREMQLLEIPIEQLTASWEKYQAEN